MKHIKVNSKLIFLNQEGQETTYPIIVSGTPEEYGTVEGTGTYRAGSTITIKAIPNDDYVFSAWDDGNTSAERLVVVNQVKTYIATFARSKTFTIGTVKRGQNSVYYFAIPQTNFQHLGEIKIQSSKLTGSSNVYEVAQYYYDDTAEEGYEYVSTGGNFITKNLTTWDDNTLTLTINDGNNIGMNPFAMKNGEKKLTYIMIRTMPTLTQNDTAIVTLQ